MPEELEQLYASADRTRGGTGVEQKEQLFHTTKRLNRLNAFVFGGVVGHWLLGFLGFLRLHFWTLTMPGSC